MPSIRLLVKKRLRKTAKWVLRLSIAAVSTLFPVEYESCKVRSGYRTYRTIKERYGENCHLFFFRGATGDVFLANSLIPAFTQAKRIQNYVFLGDGKGLKPISKLFGETNIVPLSRWAASCFQSFYKLVGQAQEDITDLFLWQHTMYFNRCRTRMLERFHFMDTYQWYVFGFDCRREAVFPSYSEPNAENQEKWRTMGIDPGRTVIISPNAYSVTGLPGDVWKQIDQALRAMGWKTRYCTNPKNEEAPFKGAQTIWFSFADSVPLLEYAGAFLSVRNGLCDIVSSAGCRMVILYPCALKKTNYSEHRSDAAFCGLRAMGLNENAVEISTPLIRNMEIQSDAYNYGHTREDVDQLIREIKKSLTK